CFCSSTSASARSARFFHRLISRSCSASFLSRGSATRRTGPRFFGAPASSPRSRAARHVVRCEEYNPSRRNNAPTAPGVLHASASRTIFRLYSTVNRRRVAFAVTSISGPPGARSSTLIVLQSLLALDTKLPGGRCLTHIGREGIVAIDSGYTEVPVQTRFPSSTLCFFQFGALSFSVADLEGLEDQPFIDPEDIARLKRIERLKLTLPVRNVALKDQPTLTASVRLALYEFFAQKMDGTSLLDTLKWFV